MIAVIIAACSKPDDVSRARSPLQSGCKLLGNYEVVEKINGVWYRYSTLNPDVKSEITGSGCFQYPSGKRMWVDG